MSDDPGPLEAVVITTADDVPDGTSFEYAIAELERCVDALEAGDVGLEEAVVLFRRGAALERWCEATLDGISAQIEELTADGSPAAPRDDA
jgi:exodeoxyribonuclease VII small subunit